MSDFKNQSPWGSPPGGGNGDGFRRGPTPPDIDEIVKNIQDKIKKFIPGGAHTYSRGKDQFPSNAPSIATKGNGAYLFGADGKAIKKNKS